MIAKPLARTIASITLGAILGLTLGAWLGRSTVLRQQQDETGLMATSYIERSDVLGAEAVNALNEIEASTVPVCSPRDLARLRHIVVSSHFLKIAARLRGREMLCSSTLGVIDPPVVLPAPDFITEHGRAVALNAALYDMPGTHALVIEQGSASVVINRDAYASLVDSRLDYAVVADHHGKRSLFMARGTSESALDGVALTSGQAINLQGRHYQVRCSTKYTGCMVATLREPDTLVQSPVFIGFAILGLLAGMGGGMGVSWALSRMNSLGSRLRLALRTGDLDIVYQPIVRLSDRRRVGAEALLRWRDAEGKHISPDIFIAIAEQEGFISQVTRFVLRHVLIELGDELRQRPDFRVTINISVQDLLDSTFAPFVAHSIQSARLSASSIGFELTERSTAEHAAIDRGIHELRSAGHCIYIDDFGTDYSSLSYLAQLHVDAIKLDRSFALALHDEPAGDSIAPQIVAMTKSLGLTLVVEGIEKDDQAAYYLALDASALAQGWLFSPPLTAARLFDPA